jgi:hypothetical protein
MGNKLKPIVLRRRHFPTIESLLNVELAGPQSRQRARFMKRFDIANLAQSIWDKKAELIKEMAEKDEEGKPKIEMVGTDRRYVWKDEETKKAYSDKLDEFRNEEITLEVNHSAQSEVLTAAGLIINTKIPLHGAIAQEHDEICTAFEEAGHAVPENTEQGA